MAQSKNNGGSGKKTSGTSKSSSSTSKKSSTKRTPSTKTVVKKEVKKFKKKHPAVYVTIVVIILIIVIVGFILYSQGYLDKFLNGGENASSSQTTESSIDSDSDSTDSSSDSDSSDSSSEETHTGEYSVENITSADLSIHFLEVGNKYTGDCTLIKCGDTEILIDAGSRQNSAETIKSYVDQYCTDGKLEYVIATHAHQDHIAGFVGNKSGTSRTGILYQYEIGTLIQFARTDVTSTLYTNYQTAVSYVETQGTLVYTALQCCNETDGAKKEYNLTEDGSVKFSVLYQRYYEEKSSDENNYSVCILLSDTVNNYLFTGDLEKEGEESLAEKNTLPHCKLFKAGHHGSPSSSNDCLLSKITPEIVCVCCCCGSTEYTSNMANVFPSQNFCDKVGKYTDQIYVTSIVADNEKGYTSMNGNIVLMMKSGELTLAASNNTIIFRKTEWFKNNRTWSGVTSDGE